MVCTARPAGRWALGTKGLAGHGDSAARKSSVRHTRDRVAAVLPRGSQTAECKRHSLAKTAPLTPSLPDSRCVDLASQRWPETNQRLGWAYELLTCGAGPS